MRNIVERRFERALDVIMDDDHRRNVWSIAFIIQSKATEIQSTCYLPTKEKTEIRV